MSEQRGQKYNLNGAEHERGENWLGTILSWVTVQSSIDLFFLRATWQLNLLRIGTILDCFDSKFVQISIADISGTWAGVIDSVLKPN